MILIEGDGKAVLYTGDIRGENIALQQQCVKTSGLKYTNSRTVVGDKPGETSYSHTLHTWGSDTRQNLPGHNVCNQSLFLSGLSIQSRWDQRSTGPGGQCAEKRCLPLESMDTGL